MGEFLFGAGVDPEAAATIREVVEGAGVDDLDFAAAPGDVALFAREELVRAAVDLDVEARVAGVVELEALSLGVAQVLLELAPLGLSQG